MYIVCNMYITHSVKITLYCHSSKSVFFVIFFGQAYTCLMKINKTTDSVNPLESSIYSEYQPPASADGGWRQ